MCKCKGLALDECCQLHAHSADLASQEATGEVGQATRVDDHLTTTQTPLRLSGNGANVVYDDNWFGVGALLA